MVDTLNPNLVPIDPGGPLIPFEVIPAAPTPVPPSFEPPGIAPTPRPPDVAFLPPVTPTNIPPSQIFIPDAPVAPGPGLGAIVGRVGFGAAIGVIAVELLSEIAKLIQEKRFRALEEAREAEIRMTRGRIEIRERDLRVETLPEAAGDLTVPPRGRDPALSDIPQFPFPDPADEPLGDDPLPDLRPPIGAAIVRFPDELEIPTEAPTPAPVVLPGPDAPTLPAPQTEPEAPPGTATPAPSPSPAPSPFPSPSPPPSPAPRTAPFALPFAFPTPSAQPRPLTGPGQPTPTPTDVPLPDLTTFEQPGVPLQQPVDRCPPCQKDADTQEPREECFKKLVKEGLFPDLDETFNWIEIDCFTGKEIG